MSYPLDEETIYKEMYKSRLPGVDMNQVIPSSPDMVEEDSSRVSSTIVRTGTSTLSPKRHKEIIEAIKAQAKGDRFNNGKLKWGLVNFKALEPMVRGLEYGAIKYSPENWKKGLDSKEILESIMRHLTALIDGESIDPESGISHMGLIQCNAMFYNYFNEIDENEED